MDALYAVLVVVLLPYAAFRFATDAKTRSRWRAYGRDLPARYARRRRRGGPRPAVWVHGVSVGEIKAVQHLVGAIERGWPSLEVLLSTSTDTGRRVALERYAGRRIEFYPPDLSWVVRDAFDALRPDLIVLVESGFWPTFLGTAHERGIPVVVVNGRMSARSAGRYAFVRAGLRQVLGTLAEACVQLDAYGERFRELGVPAERVHRVGNMKLDNLPSGAEDPRREAFRARRRLMDLRQGKRVFGSRLPVWDRIPHRWSGKRTGQPPDFSRSRK
jgi:3-deoxy-D-manno-octulosonic-acid transferase